MSHNPLYAAKTNLAVLFASLALIQNKAFAMPDSVYDIQYKIHANNVNMAPIIIMAAVLLCVLLAYYKVSNVGKYETFSVRCKKCGSITRGLKCVVCQRKKMAKK